MEINGKIFIISDIHLKRKDPRAKALADFINSADAHVVLLGDIFDIWIGRNKEFEDDFSEIISVFESQAKKNERKIIYIEGNHDFHLVWLEDLGIGRFTEAYITINKQKFFFSHGDLYSGELSHMVYRRAVLRTEKLFRAVANGYLEKAINRVGEFLSYISYKRNSHPALKGKRMKIAINMLEKAFAIAEEKKAEVVIFGHCHIPMVIKSQGKTYANSGFWGHNRGTFLEISEDNNIFIRTVDF